LHLHSFNQYLNITFYTLYFKIKHKASKEVFLDPKLKKMRNLFRHSEGLAFFLETKNARLLHYYPKKLPFLGSNLEIDSFMTWELMSLDPILQKTSLIKSEKPQCQGKCGLNLYYLAFFDALKERLATF